MDFVAKIGQRSKNCYWKINLESEKLKPRRVASIEFSVEVCLESPKGR